MTVRALESVQQVFADNGCTLLELNYTNNAQPLRFICSCGQEGERRLSKFLKAPFCKTCGYKQAGDKNGRMTLEAARAVFSTGGCTLLAGEYTNNVTKLPYLCKCGSLHAMSLANFKKGRECPNCIGKTQWTFETVSEVYRSHACELLEGSYVSMNARMKYRCSCGVNSLATFGSFLKGVRCKACGIKKLSGPNNRMYDHNMTPEQRADKRLYPEYRQWRKAVLQRDDYTCRICGTRGSRMHAHHLDSYARHPELRTNPDNGVTLCKPCHDQFHIAHGVCRPTTRIQFTTYLEITNG